MSWFRAVLCMLIGAIVGASCVYYAALVDRLSLEALHKVDVIILLEKNKENSYCLLWYHVDDLAEFKATVDDLPYITRFLTQWTSLLESTSADITTYLNSVDGKNREWCELETDT